MKIKSLHIKNFKSIVDLTINEPNPFTVFVGPNGSGKSNIFEALELYSYYSKFDYDDTERFFGGKNEIINQNKYNDFQNLSIAEKEKMGYDYGFEVAFESLISNLFVDVGYYQNKHSSTNKGSELYGDFYNIYKKDGWYKSKNFKFALNDTSLTGNKEYQQFFSQFSKIFVHTKKENRQNFTDDKKLNFNTNNLEKVLKRLLENKEKREEISEWLELFLPEFDRIEVQKSEFSSNENLLIYQKHYKSPFNKELISDGTFNIIALLTAVYQSDEPQFLCIEEPENGLHPKVIKQLVNFFRDACEEKGHYIWLNTHSQTLVSMLEEKEMIIVDKKNGETQIKQFKEGDFYGMPADEALLTNALGGGLPW